MPSIAQLEKLLALDANDPFVLYGLAQAHASSGDHATAITWYDRCIAANGDECYAYFHKARSCEALGDTAAAVAALRTGLARARATGDAKAASEIAGYLDELTP